MSLRFEVTHVFPGSEKQVGVGIYATFNMNILYDNNIVVSLKELKLNKNSKDNRFYIGQPYRESKSSKDGTTKKIYYAKIWPEEKNWPKQEPIIRAVQEKLEQEKKNQPRNRQGTVASSSSSSAADEAW